MPFIDFTAGDKPTAAQFDTMFRQGVMTFADASARNTALSSVLDEGMLAYLEDTNLVTFYDGANWQIATGRFGCTLTQSGQAIGTGVTATVTYDAETEDSGSFHTGSGQVIIPTGGTGLYAISAHVNPGTPVSGLSKVSVLVGGSEVAAAYIPASGSNVSVSLTMTLAAAAVVTVSVSNGHSGSLNWAVTTRCYRVGY